VARTTSPSQWSQNKGIRAETGLGARSARIGHLALMRQAAKGGLPE